MIKFKKTTGKSLRGFPFLLLMLLVGFQAYAQQPGSEVGGGIGVMSYTGDLVRGFDFSQSQLAGNFYYRYNFNNAVSVKLGATFGGVTATEEPIDAFAAQRDASFDVFIFEAAGIFEYHFLNWRNEKTKLRFTPYVFTGFGLFGISGHEEKPTSYSNVQPVIPLGVGFKYVLNPKWYVGIEFGGRKTFFDYIDNVSEADQADRNFQSGNQYDKDMYYYTGLSLTYSFYNIACPTSPYK